MRQEDFQTQAETYANTCGGTTQEKCATMTDYFAGAEYGYTYAVDKMAEYLLSSLEAELGYFATGDFVKGVMKFMEGL